MDVKAIAFDQSDDIVAAIRNRETFNVVGCGHKLGKAAVWVEKAIENEGLKCRIYSKGRSTLLAGFVIPTGITQIAAAAAAIGIAAHNLATFNPDYQIMKREIDHSLKVTYKKKKALPDPAADTQPAE